MAVEDVGWVAEWAEGVFKALQNPGDIRDDIIVGAAKQFNGLTSKNKEAAWFYLLGLINRQDTNNGN